AQDKAEKQLRELDKAELEATTANTKALERLTQVINAKDTLQASAPPPPSGKPTAKITAINGEPVENSGGTKQRSSGGTMQRADEDPIAVAPGETVTPRSRVPTVQWSGDSQPIAVDEAVKAARASEAATRTFVTSSLAAHSATEKGFEAVAEANKRLEKKADNLARQMANSR
ncbi:MAG: hypothetical protein ACREF9_08075, partial [Opitutaceae bacterium]